MRKINYKKYVSKNKEQRKYSLLSIFTSLYNVILLLCTCPPIPSRFYPQTLWVQEELISSNNQWFLDLIHLAVSLPAVST